MPITNLPDTVRKLRRRHPSRRRHAWLAAAAASLALLIVPAGAMADASVVGWGWQPPIGLGAETVISVPPVAIPGAQDATAAAVGGGTSYVLTPGGIRVGGFGSNLGLAGVSVDQDHPLAFTLIPGTADAKAVATGRDSTLILESDGTVDGFGGNQFGEAGGEPGTAIEIPTPITGLTDVTAIAPGFRFSVALKADGTVWNWGSHTYLGSTTAAAGPDTGTPTQVTLPAGNPATAIAAGAGHCLVLLQDGSVWAWAGYNGRGQVGDGTIEKVTVPVQVIPPAPAGQPDVVSVSAGNSASFALYSDGTYKAWGENYFGQLGLGLGTAISEEPVTQPTSPAVAAHPSAYPPLKRIVSTQSTTYAIVGDSDPRRGQVLVWGTGGGFGFGENTPAYTYAWPYDPANPDTPGTSDQGATEIPQRLGRLKDVPWLGVGPSATTQIAPTGSTLKAIYPQFAFFSHPVGTVSAPRADVFTSIGEASEVTSMRITGPDAEDFWIAGTGTYIGGIGPHTVGAFLSLPFTVPADGGFEVLVRFSPTALGERFATLEVSGQGETASVQLNGYGTELPGNTPGPQGVKGQSGSAGPAGQTGPAGPAGKNGVVVFAATRSQISAKRGRTASLSFLLVNGTSAKLDGATVRAAVPRALGSTGAAGSIGVPSLRAGASRQVKIPLKIADSAKLGLQRVKVAFEAGGRRVIRTVGVTVTP